MSSEWLRVRSVRTWRGHTIRIPYTDGLGHGSVRVAWAKKDWLTGHVERIGSKWDWKLLRNDRLVATGSCNTEAGARAAACRHARKLAPLTDEERKDEGIKL